MNASWSRVFYTATVGHTVGITADHRGRDVWLHVQRGALHLTISQRNLGQHETTHAEEQLSAAVGDLFIVCGPSVDETAMASVLEVEGNALRVYLSGPLEERTTRVQLMSASGVKRRSKAA